MKKFTAIDIYSGIGGWTLGLKLANVDIVASYEWWGEANLTHNLNFNTNNKEVNIRELSLDDLPKPHSIDFVVGSPPCTQFSYSNRGGSGNISDGLKDIKKFLEIIDYLKPKYWAMENVPRVARVLKKEIEPKGSLSKFSSLITTLVVVNMIDYGVPQARKRMIAGHFPLKLLESYKNKQPYLTLGDILLPLQGDIIKDPIYGIKITKDQLTDNDPEVPLSKEEIRMNKESKTYHPVYNKMNFPDLLDKPARTITATCTRVSRESIIIRTSKRSRQFRRLTARERGLLQTFPVTYQFYGRSYSSKLKMIGNAIPPLMAYYIVNSMLEKSCSDVPLPHHASYRHSLPKKLPEKVKLDSIGKKYPVKRKFWAAIPNLRFGSGVRFDLTNNFINDKMYWQLNFYYGTSKDIKNISLNGSVHKTV